MKGTFPIICCDHEDGCTEWTLDWYEAMVHNWRELMAKGWQFDPHKDDVPHLCPEHANGGLS
jgi:hypothetical protein